MALTHGGALRHVFFQQQQNYIVFVLQVHNLVHCAVQRKVQVRL